MTAFHNLKEFAGLPVEDFQRGQAAVDPTQAVYRFRQDYDEDQEELPEVLEEYLALPGSDGTRALVIGLWGQPYESSSSPLIEALAASAAKLPELRHLFLGDIVSEECELSWIQQSNVGPVLQAYPSLESLHIRGGSGLRMDFPGHGLRKLVIETGGMPAEVVRSLAAADLPQLQELVLWLGVEEYGATWTVEDLEPLLTGERLPALRRLALANSLSQDEIATRVAKSPLLGQLEHLDLSLGSLGDQGAEALLQAPSLSLLRSLDLRHHYMSKGMMERLRALPLELHLDAPQKPDHWGGADHRYVEFSE